MKDTLMEQFDASGLGLMVRLLRICGFRVDRDPAFEPVINRWVCGFNLATGLINLCVAFPSMFLTLPDSPVEMTSLSIVVIVSTSGYATTIIIYILLMRAAAKYSALMRSLVTAISHISDDAFRRKTASGLRITFILLLFPVAGSCLPLIYTQTKGQFWFKNYNNPSKNPTLLVKIISSVSFGAHFLWVATNCVFYAINTCAVVVVCKALVNLIDYNLPEKKPVGNLWAQIKQNQSSDINRRLVLHEKMSLLVRETDQVYSSFLMISLCIELIIGVVYVKMMTMSGGRFSFAAHNYAFHLLFFILKAYSCAKVNDKLKASLVMNQHPNSTNDYDYCSTRQVNYIFYVNEQQMNRAEITYGGFIAIKKTFIFTVAGTILTYALVLTGMPDSTNIATPYHSQLSNITSDALTY